MEWLYSRRVFSADLMKEQPVAALVNETYRVLSEGVNSSITQEVPKELTNNLRENTFRFSGFKTYHQMKEASLLLEDKKGGFKTYESFQRDVLSIDNRYNRQYLEAEYNFAVQSTQMAVKWKDFEKDGNDYNLQYRTANDGRVREEHAVLHGTTLPVDDPFWDKYYPPLGWNCRCTVVQVRKNKYDVSNSQEAIAAGERATAKPKQQIFRFNPGKTKNVFPPKHPYMPKGCGNCTRGLHLAYNANSEQCKACMALTEQERIAMRKEEYRELKKDPNYKDVIFDESTGGLKATHKDHNFAPKGGDYEKMVQEAGFKNGHCVIFTGEKSRVIGKRFAEGKWDGQIFEVAGTETATANNILRGLKHCASKRITQIAVLYFANGGYSRETLDLAINRYVGLKKLKDGQFIQFERLMCIQGNEIVYSEPLKK